MLLKVDSFQFAVPLYLNMGYYRIQLSEDAINLFDIILPWGEYHYKHLPMVLSNSQELF